MRGDSKHRAFIVVFFTQLFQSFSLLGLRSFLVLYLIQGLQMSDATAYMVFGSYVSLLCIAPAIGGYLTDRYLGAIKAITLGGILSVVGLLITAVLPQSQLFLGLSSLVVGTSLMLPTLCNTVGMIYQDDQLQHDQAYNYFYIAVNIGGIFAALLLGFVTSSYGWQIGFQIVLGAMLLSISVFLFAKNNVAAQIKTTTQVDNKHPWLIISLILASIGVIDFFLHTIQYIKWLLFAVGLFAIGNLVRIYLDANKQHRSNLLFLTSIFFVMTFYFVMYEQSGTSIMLFTERVIDRHFLMHTIPTPMLSALNPFYVIAFTPLLGVLWARLSNRQIEPGILSKIALGIIITSIGFLVLATAGHFAHPTLGWLVLASLLLTLGELLVGPVSLAAISNLAPPEHKTTILGIWFIVGSIASYLSAMLARLTSAGPNIADISGKYINIFNHLAIYGLLIGGSILVMCQIFSNKNTH